MSSRRRCGSGKVSTRSDKLAVHVLDQANHRLASLFGEQTGDTTDKFAACSWRQHQGLPVLTDAHAWFIGLVLQRIDLGDHTGHLLEPLETEADGTLDQLAFQQIKSMKPGHPA